MQNTLYPLKKFSIIKNFLHHKLLTVSDTILNAEGKEELKILLMKVKEESEKLNIQKTNIMASGPISSWQIDGETMETVTGYFLGLQNHCSW